MRAGIENLKSYAPIVAGDRSGLPVSFRLPGGLDRAFRDGASGAVSEFARWAVLAFMLRHGWVRIDACPLLPYVVRVRVDCSVYDDFRLGESAAHAIALALSDAPPGAEGAAIRGWG